MKIINDYLNHRRIMKKIKAIERAVENLPRETLGYIDFNPTEQPEKHIKICPIETACT
jgi:hypothetical protein